MTLEQFERYCRGVVKDPATGCRISDLGCNSWGYPYVRIDGNQLRCNRLVLSLKLKRKIRRGFWALHTCDNTRCIEKKHIYEGTRKENDADRVRRGRSSMGDKHYSRTSPEKLSRGDSHYARQCPEKLARGEFHGQAVLNNKKVDRMRTMYATGNYSQQTLADKFGVHQATVSRVVLEKNWRI